MITCQVRNFCGGTLGNALSVYVSGRGDRDTPCCFMLQESECYFGVDTIEKFIRFDNTVPSSVGIVLIVSGS